MCVLASLSMKRQRWSEGRPQRRVGARWVPVAGQQPVATMQPTPLACCHTVDLRPCSATAAGYEHAMPVASSKRRTAGALVKPLTPSAELAAIVDIELLPRSAVVSRMWDHIQANDLQDRPTSGRSWPTTRSGPSSEKTARRCSGCKSCFPRTSRPCPQQHDHAARRAEHAGGHRPWPLRAAPPAPGGHRLPRSGRGGCSSRQGHPRRAGPRPRAPPPGPRPTTACPVVTGLHRAPRNR